VKACPGTRAVHSRSSGPPAERGPDCLYPMFERSHAERIACPDCGLVQWLPEIAAGQVAQCVQCAKMLTRRTRGGIDVPLTLAATALVLLIPANLAPLMSVSERGAQRENWLSTGVATLWSSGYEFLAILVAAFTIVIPFLYLTLLVDGARQHPLRRAAAPRQGVSLDRAPAPVDDDRGISRRRLCCLQPAAENRVRERGSGRLVLDGLGLRIAALHRET
jgi:ribosomal protein S27E